ncbi:helix-turn-helix domain-containing protein [Roseovarius sp.]|uniref:GlxA family transcriptional regulator n=1 Tax=Roseovarius sp. TaxID=1486281 RepID=UPI000C563100|nr:helix-turn-helix domain-containing protein [Roseovarius sp.]MAZ21051.1 AraC family transcriptional regulator [Roseovarius sp.]|tara:strand:- start:2443 stop:3381 length:939 start_codon:yes stop_codon:yes gene_type:complete
MDPATTIQLIDYPGAQKSALWGMKDVLDFANTQAETIGPAILRADICSEPDGKPGMTILPPALTLEPPVLPARWKDKLMAQHKGGTVLASVCLGAFLLAETGVLDRRRITTHWRHAAVFRQRYPKVIIDTDRLLVDLGDIVTAGGVMAWTDLSLHLIERFGGRKLMLDVARLFVLDPPEREQSYYATFVPNTKHKDQSVAAIQILLQEDPGGAHTVGSLAQAAMMSERSLLRRFKQATGMTPVTYLQFLRVKAARSRLELTRDSFERISWDLGYGDTAAFRRVFRRIVGLTPSDYRRRFGLGVSPQASGRRI